MKRTALIATVPLIAVLAVVLSAGIARAAYFPDGAVQNGTTGGWNLPTDFVCIVGVHLNGTLDIADGVTDRHTCQSLFTGTMNGGTPFNLSAMTTQASCTTGNGTAPNDGAKHAWSTSLCLDGSGNAISLKDLDRSSAMCTSKGGTWVTTGKCVAYGAQFKGQDANGTPLAFGAKGTTQGPGTGYCYTTMNMTTAYPSQAACPSNQSAVAPFNVDAAYDWSWSSSKCTYAKGIAGYLNAALTKADGTTIAAGTFIDFSAGTNVGGSPITTMGDCVALGASWSNWTGQAASTTSIPTDTNANCTGNGAPTKCCTGAGTGTCVASTIPAWNYQTQAPDADAGCLHCHSTTVQYNSSAERWKSSYLMTGHKNMLRKVTAGKNWAGPDANGVLQIYTAYAAGTLNFTTATAQVSGVDKPLLYVFGDWMAPAPAGLDVIVNIGGSAKYNGTSNYSCAPCHSTGWSDNATPAASRIGLCVPSSAGSTMAACAGAGGTWYPSIGVKGIGNSSYVPQEPAASFPGITFTGAGQWDLEGIRCSRCHNAAVGTTTAAAIATSQFPTTYPQSGGMGNIPGGPEAAGTYATFLCYGCHQQIAKTNNGVGADNDLSHPEALPVKNSVTTGTCSNPTKTSESTCQSAGGIWTPTAYVPAFAGAAHVLGGSFLGSVHARATGTIVPNSLGKYDLVTNLACTAASTPYACCTGAGTGTCLTFGSSFTGYTCWQSATSTTPAITWIDSSETTEAGCEADGGQWSSGSCIKEIKDSTTCQNLYPGGWRAASQGSCATCHDVHNSLFVAGEQEKALRKTCQNCHVDNATTGATVPTAPQVVVSGINHLMGPGTPFDASVGESPCVVCHMPKPTSADFAMHVWRINPDVNYSTFPSAAEYGAGTVPTKKNANTAPDGAYTNAVWVDLDLACGQCHGGGSMEDAQHQSKVSQCTAAGVPDACCNGPGSGSCAKYRTKDELAPVAETMHAGAATTYPTTFSTSVSGLTVNMTASVSCNGCSLTYVWDCGAGGTLTQPSTTVPTASCAYGSPGAKSITLTVMEGGGNAGTAARSVTLYAATAAPPVPGGLGGVGCPNLAFNANTWTASFTDATTPAGTLVVVQWGDGSVDFKSAGASFSHAYLAAGSYLIVQKVISSTLQLALAPPCALTAGSFTIDGHIYKSDGVTPLGAATVSLRSGTTGNTIKTAYTYADGSFTIGSLKPDTYWLVVSKRGYTFPAPTQTGNPAVTVGPNVTGVSIKANP